jgi:hypothetical protein
MVWRPKRDANIAGDIGRHRAKLLPPGASGQLVRKHPDPNHWKPTDFKKPRKPLPSKKVSRGDGEDGEDGEDGKDCEDCEDCEDCKDYEEGEDGDDWEYSDELGFEIEEWEPDEFNTDFDPPTFSWPSHIRRKRASTPSPPSTERSGHSIDDIKSKGKDKEASDFG